MLTIAPLAVCGCNGEVEPTRADDLQGVTEYMCATCGTFFPVLQRGETWEPRDNETEAAYVARMNSYMDRVR